MDCIDGMSLLDPKSVDVIVTSPPYNIGIKYASYKDNLKTEDYLNWVESIAIVSKRVLKDGGSFFLNTGGSLKEPWISYDIASRFGKHYVLQNTIHWIKSISLLKSEVGKASGLNDDISIGHYKPINSSRYHHNCHEYIWHFTKNGDVALEKTSIGVSYQDKTNINRWNKPNGLDRRDRGNVWFIPYKTITSAPDHPSMFPERLPEMCILDHGIRKNMLVIDPFAGVGTTGAVCKKLGVDFIGFEIDNTYSDIANENINKI